MHAPDRSFANPLLSCPLSDESEQLILEPQVARPQIVVGYIEDSFPESLIVLMLQPVMSEMLVVKAVHFWRDPGWNMYAVGH
jgi:hypothetical protein